MVQAAGNDPNTIFDHFYRDMNVMQFGRLGKFDFLCLIGRMGFAPITPGSAYLVGATGPLRGAKLLFANDVDAGRSVRDLDAALIQLDGAMHVGMQVMEDSLCNWQKSPDKFIHFVG